MNKKELVSQLTSLVEGYTDGLISANNRLFNSIQRERVEKQEWAQKYHMVMADNKGLEEQNGILQEKAASLATLNETLSAEAQNWQGQCVELQGKYSSVLKELAEKESSCSKAFAAAEERHEDFKKRSDGILATMGENLQKRQEQIEALTAWKEFAENTINELSEKLESLKQINSFQEYRIEVLSRKTRKLQKKEQND